MNQKWNSYRSDYDDRLALNLLEDRLNSVHPRQVRVHLGAPNRYVIFPGFFPALRFKMFRGWPGLKKP